MTPPKSPPQPAVSVEQAHRDIAADLIDQCRDIPAIWNDRVRAGQADEHPLVQFVARLPAAPPAMSDHLPIIQSIVEDAMESAIPEPWDVSLHAAERIDAYYRAHLKEPKGCPTPGACSCEAASTPADGVPDLEALGEKLFILSDHLRRSGVLSDAGTHIAYEDVVAEFQNASAAPKAPTAPIGEAGLSVPDADGLKSIGHDLAMAAGNLVVATDGQEAIRAERIAVLNALKAWEKAIADRVQGEGEKAS